MDIKPATQLTRKKRGPFHVRHRRQATGCLMWACLAIEGANVCKVAVAKKGGLGEIYNSFVLPNLVFNAFNSLPYFSSTFARANAKSRVCLTTLISLARWASRTLVDSGSLSPDAKSDMPKTLASLNNLREGGEGDGERGGEGEGGEIR